MSGEQYSGWVRVKHIGGGFAAVNESDLGGQPPSAGLYYLDSSGTVRAIPLLNNNITSISPGVIIINEPTSLSIVGQNFTGGTTFDFGDNVTVNSTTINSSTSATVNITATSTGDRTVVAGVYGDAEGGSSVLGVFSSVIVPGDGTTSWDNSVNVSTGEGTIAKNAGGAAWDAGASFDSVSSGSDFSFDFAPDANLTGTRKAMVGMAETWSTVSYTDIGYGIYFGSGSNTINALENGTVGASLGTYSASDSFSIKREGTIMSLHKNGTLIHTYSDTSNEATLIGKFSILSNTAGVENISLKVE